MNEKRDAYVQQLKAKMDEWKNEINELEAKAEQAKEEVETQYRQQIDEYRAKRKEIEDKIAEMEKAEDGVWEDLKEGIENSWEWLKSKRRPPKTFGFADLDEK